MGEPYLSFAGGAEKVRLPFVTAGAQRYPAPMNRGALLLVGLTACISPVEPAPAMPKTAAIPSVAPPPAPPPAIASAAAPTAEPIPEGEPLRAGVVAFTGVVRPTKGGYSVLGVVLDRGDVETKSGAREAALLGAKLRVVAHLERRPPASPQADGIVAQTRDGGFHVIELHEVEIIAPPEVIEGVVSRSKGLFQVGDRMVSQDDLAWSLQGEQPVGQRVRLWGQPRDYRCPPMAQCLIEGVIPMFDVGRAELLP